MISHLPTCPGRIIILLTLRDQVPERDRIGQVLQWVVASIKTMHMMPHINTTRQEYLRKFIAEAPHPTPQLIDTRNIVTKRLSPQGLVVRNSMLGLPRMVRLIPKFPSFPVLLMQSAYASSAADPRYPSQNAGGWPAPQNYLSQSPEHQHQDTSSTEASRRLRAGQSHVSGEQRLSMLGSRPVQDARRIDNWRN